METKLRAWARQRGLSTSKLEMRGDDDGGATAWTGYRHDSGSPTPTGQIGTEVYMCALTRQCRKACLPEDCSTPGSQSSHMAYPKMWFLEKVHKRG